MARPTEKYIEPIPTDMKNIARAMFGKDVKKLIEEEKKLLDEWERIKNSVEESGDEELGKIWDDLVVAVKKDREGIEKMKKALEGIGR